MAPRGGSQRRLAASGARKPCTSGCACDAPSAKREEGRHVATQRPPRPLDASKAIVFVNDLPGLKKILDDDTQLVMWRQPSPPKFSVALSDPSVAPEALPHFEGMVPALEGMVAEVLKGYIWTPYALRSRKSALDEEGTDELVQHVDRLVQVFADIAQESGYVISDDDKIPFVHVKLHVIRDNGCKFWHQDCVPFRLCTTFRGPCTEWVYPEFSKETLKQRQSDSKHAQSMSLNDVAIFKGRGDADATFLYDQPGIVHRSPRVREGDFRLLLVIDIPQKGWHFDE